MKYDPKEASNCLPPGDYQATIMKAVETASKSGKEMIVIEFKVYGPGNRTIIVDDYILREFLWKLKRIATAIGRLNEFNSGEFVPEHYIGCNCTVTLDIEDSPDFGEQNRVRGCKSSTTRQTQNYSEPLPPPPPSRNDADIPF